MVFAALAAALPLGLLEALLAALGVRPVTETRDPFVGFAGRLPLFVQVADSQGVRRVTAPNKLKFFNEQSFAQPKPPGTFRIFCMGGSTTYGHPYRDPVSFPGWLRELLSAAAPTQRWEVINCGGISYASYREAALMEELAQYEPDLFVVVNGHNEFLEKRTYGKLARQSPARRALHRAVSSLRLYAMVERLVMAGRRAGSARLGAEVHTQLDDSVGLDAYERDDALREQVIAHYAFNMNRMVSLARAAGAGILLATPVSQLRDCAPFKSVGEAAPAHATLDDLQRAVARDPRQAANHFRLAQALVAAGRANEARPHYEAARDEDVVPLRALAELGAVVRAVGRERGVPVVDLEREADAWALARSGVGIPGAELFTDHVHLTVEGYRLMALSILRELTAQKLIPSPVSASDELVARVTAAVEGRQNRRDQGLALRNLAKTLSWAGKSDEAARLAGQAMELMGADAECFFVQGVAAAERAQWAVAAEYYQQASALDTNYTKARHNLAVAWGRLGRNAEAVALYREIIQAQPDHPSASYNLALAYDRMGEITQAIHWARATLRRNRADDEARSLLAELEALPQNP